MFGSKGGGGPEARRHSIANIANIIWRLFQLVAGAAVLGYYVTGIREVHKVEGYSGTKWIFAAVVGGLSVFTALMYGTTIAFGHSGVITTIVGCGWEWILTILWAATSGIFCSMYLKTNVEADNALRAMKMAAIFDLVGLAFWALSAIIGSLMCFRAPKRPSHSDRVGD